MADAAAEAEAVAEAAVGEKRAREEEGGAREVAEEGAPAEQGKRAAREAAAVKLGPLTFDLAEDAVSYFSQLLGAATPRQNMNEYERMVLNALLERGHPAYADKAGSHGIKHFMVDDHPEFGSKCFWLVRGDGSREDFSYRKCVLQLWPGVELPSGSTGGTPRRSFDGGRGGRGGRRGQFRAQRAWPGRKPSGGNRGGGRGGRH